MLNCSDRRKPEPIEPDIDLARRTANVAHRVVVAFQEMGLPESYNDDLARLGTDLGDLWSAHNALNTQLESLFRAQGDWDAVGDRLVDLKSSMDHIAWHLKSVRRPMGRINRYAYGRARRQTAADRVLLGS